MKPALQTLAARQLADYDAHKPGSVFAEGCALTVEEAYRLQIEVARLREARGERVAGYKIGCVSPAVQQQLGVESPIFGHVFSSEVRTSGADLSSRRFDGLGIEGELAVELSEDVNDPEDLRDGPASFVASVFPVIELHHYVIRGNGPSAAELIANNALHAGIVTANSRTILPGPCQISVSINGGQRGVAAPDPFATLYPLAVLLKRFGIGLRRGHILLTGSPLPLYRVESGDRIDVDGSHTGKVAAKVIA